mmetsp:Transcript_20722/g.61266  ORF Transcript_20722/g.61266 Transcript_20722/m.61266 type:complete len:252 (-) Transcript_20722:719-1474(-)
MVSAPCRGPWRPGSLHRDGTFRGLRIRPRRVHALPRTHQPLARRQELAPHRHGPGSQPRVAGRRACALECHRVHRPERRGPATKHQFENGRQMAEECGEAFLPLRPARPLRAPGEGGHGRHARPARPRRALRPREQARRRPPRRARAPGGGSASGRSRDFSKGAPLRRDARGARKHRRGRGALPRAGGPSGLLQGSRTSLYSPSAQAFQRGAKVLAAAPRRAQRPSPAHQRPPPPLRGQEALGRGGKGVPS